MTAIFSRGSKIAGGHRLLEKSPSQRGVHGRASHGIRGEGRPRHGLGTPGGSCERCGFQPSLLCLLAASRERAADSEPAEQPDRKVDVDLPSSELQRQVAEILCGLERQLVDGRVHAGQHGVRRVARWTIERVQCVPGGFKCETAAGQNAGQIVAPASLCRPGDRLQHRLTHERVVPGIGITRCFSDEQVLISGDLPQDVLHRGRRKPGHGRDQLRLDGEARDRRHLQDLVRFGPKRHAVAGDELFDAHALRPAFARASRFSQGRLHQQRYPAGPPMELGGGSVPGAGAAGRVRCRIEPHLQVSLGQTVQPDRRRVEPPQHLLQTRGSFAA